MYLLVQVFSTISENYYVLWRFVIIDLLEAFDSFSENVLEVFILVFVHHDTRKVPIKCNFGSKSVRLHLTQDLRDFS